MPTYSESSEFFITVIPTGHVEVRCDTVTLRDGVEIARRPHRHVLAPGDDLSAEDIHVVAIAEAAWTPDVIAAQQARVAAAKE